MIVAVLMVVLAACSGNSSNSSNQDNNSENSKVDFPTKNIKVIVPFAPGGAVDTINRIIAKYDKDYLEGQKIVVENKEGGGAVIGQSYVASQEADGYTLLAFTSSVVSNSMTGDTNYTHEDFDPIVMYSFEPELLVVPSNSSLETFEDIEAKAKDQGIKLATPGHSTSHHTAGILLAENYDWDLDFVHTESGGEQLQQLLGNHVEAALLTYGEVQAQIEEGTIRALGVMNDERLESLEDVPTFKENDIDIVYGPFRGLAAPKGLDEGVKSQLEEMFTNILNDEKFQDDMKKSGFELVYGDAKELQEKTNTEYEFIEQVLPLLLED